jgi:hypothetical protein
MFEIFLENGYMSKKYTPRVICSLNYFVRLAKENFRMKIILKFEKFMLFILISLTNVIKVVTETHVRCHSLCMGL